nr:hypothetical protein [Halomonas salinarum]
MEENRLEIVGVSGTSAGAMNAVVLADGLHRSSREGAREVLHTFWKGVSDAARFSPIQRTAWDQLMGNNGIDSSPSYLFFESLTQRVAPAKLNPLGIKPLRNLVDCERVNACTPWPMALPGSTVPRITILQDRPTVSPTPPTYLKCPTPAPPALPPIHLR